MTTNALHTKKILLVDDEPELLSLLSAIFTAEGFKHVCSACDVTSALETFQKEQPDLAILDVSLPDGDGFTLYSYLQSLKKTDVLPVIFLTAKDETADRLTGLKLGADDYLTKPFSPQELILRVYAVLRRCYPESASIVSLDNCTLDFASIEVIQKNGERINLTAKEFSLLSILARNQNRIVTTDHLCEECWGSSFGYEQSLMTHIRRIREKIEKDPSHPISLITVKGLGYKLVTCNKSNER